MRTVLRDHSAWIWLIGALALVVGIQFASSDRPSTAPRLSVRSAGPDGALAAYLWLQRIGYHPVRETGAGLGLGRLRPGRDTLVFLQYGLPVSAGQVSRALSWADSGGRLVVGTDGVTAPAILDELHVAVLPANLADIRVVQPLLLQPPVAALQGTAEVALGALGATSPVTSDGSPVLQRISRGRGEIWLLSAPLMLSNAAIAMKDNRRLLLNLVGAPGSTVAFDEYNGGVAATQTSPSGGGGGGGPSSSGGWFTGTAWGAGLLFLAAVLILYRWLSGWRLGPAIIPLSDQHRPLTEYVTSVGGLLQRARKRDDVLRTYQVELQRLVTRRYGADERNIDPDRRERLERLLQPFDHLTDEELIRRATGIAQFEEEWRKSGV